MSSQAVNAVGPNAIMSYFPWFSYYQRRQIGFDIIVNHPDTQADPSSAGQSHRLIHVRLYFPDGFICNPAKFDRMPHPPSSAEGAPHFFPPHPHINPPMYPAYPLATPPFYHNVPSGSQGPHMGQEQLDAHVVVYVVNGQPCELVVIDDTPYDIIPQCKVCREFLTGPEHVHSKRPQRVPKRKPSQQPHKSSRRSRQHSSTLGTTGQKDTSYAATYTAHESVATDTKIHHKDRNEPKLTQQMAGKSQHGPHEGMQDIQCKDDNVTSVCSQPTVATITKERDQLEISGQNNDVNVVQCNEEFSADPKVDNENVKDDKAPHIFTIRKFSNLVSPVTHFEL